MYIYIYTHTHTHTQLRLYVLHFRDLKDKIQILPSGEFFEITNINNFKRKKKTKTLDCRNGNDTLGET